MKIRLLYSLLLIGILFASCNRDKEAPVITISSPANNTEVLAGESFNLRATITDNEGLASISFTDGNTTESITDFDELTSHDINYSIRIFETSDPGELTITVNASDLEGNSASEDVTIIITN